MLSCLRILALALALAAAGAAWAQKAPFDLTGPALQVSVTRGGVTLPISEVPDLAAGDRLHIQADLPRGQGARYLLVAAFLRGATNPPPKDWFFADETWQANGRGGFDLTVPSGAEQALVFLAPHTGGDFRTLSGAVRARPGAFVRAAQDLEQLDLDRARLEAFLAAVRDTDRTHPEALEAVSKRLARSLGIKLDQSCFSKTPALEAPCLLKDQDVLVLDDGHSSSMVQTLASGSTADLINELGVAPAMGGGLYSPYVGAVMDIVRILDGMRTAHFQYIPALALAQDDRLVLRLNTPPSFADPKSVLVVALPPVAPAPAPPLRAVDPDSTHCLARTELVLPVDGAPLVFATRFAHDMTLRVKTRAGETLDIPLRADATQGGFVAPDSDLDPALFPDAATGVVHGRWGFADFDGPSFRFAAARTGAWRLADNDVQALVVGRTDTLRLVGGPAECVRQVKLEAAGGTSEPLSFKVAGADALTVTAPLTTTTPGEGALVIETAGGPPERVAVKAYAQPGRLDRFIYHAGDAAGVLEGARLDEVAGLTLGGVRFSPGLLTSAAGADRLELQARAAPDEPAVRPGAKVAARVTLTDGRSEKLEAQVLPSRPRILIAARTVRGAPDTGAVAFELSDPDDVARGAVLAFSIQAQAPAAFGPDEAAEAQTGDGAWSAKLQGPGELVLADPHAAVATLDTAKAFSPSAWGPLRVRIADDHGESDWQPLGDLVRLPHIDSLACAHGGACRLKGQDLFLLSAVSADPAFANPVIVPDGFPGDTLDVPHPRDGRLYVRLHDDPQVVDVMRLK